MSNSTEKISLNVCKKCGGSIEDGGLCSYECEFDGTYIDDRPTEMVEVRVYRFDRAEPYVKKEPVSQ